MTTDEEAPSHVGADPYAHVLRSGHGPVYLRLTDGRRIRMPVHQWYAQPTVAAVDQEDVPGDVAPGLIGCPETRSGPQCQQRDRQRSLGITAERAVRLALDR
ncbi:hypothetical protein ABZW30_22090 [Kitasatospora sp. NPDC004669]|uniref:hypothetical protein n=1 Tax=Kitasatospora sp. NPDC004669 TaxID=3154555 RepID=UPI0033BA3094